MKSKFPKHNRTTIRSNILLLTLSLVFTFFTLEAFLRVYHRLVNDIPFNKSTATFLDKELGWKGKKVFGNASSDKYKIFVIGDSFTHGLGLDEEKIYYSLIAKNLNAEMFVFAGSGYGTLQEYIALDKYFDVIRPDLVILQTCYNDFINNSWELESASFYNNNGRIRPYLIQGEIQYFYSRFSKKIAAFMWLRSRLFYSVANRVHRLLERLARKGFLHTVEEDIKEKGIELRDFRNAVKITDELIVKIKRRIGKTPIVAFVVDGKQPYLEQFKKIFQRNNIEFIEDIQAEIKQEETNGNSPRFADYIHWNEFGHQICGRILTEKLKQKDYGKKRDPYSSSPY